MRNEFVLTMAQVEHTMIQQEKLEAEEIREQKVDDWNRVRVLKSTGDDLISATNKVGGSKIWK